MRSLLSRPLVPSALLCGLVLSWPTPASAQVPAGRIEFGPDVSAASLDVDGARLVVGNTRTKTGEALVYEPGADGRWTLVADLQPAHDVVFAGSSVAVQGDRIAMSTAFLADWSAPGPVEVFEFEGGNWARVAELSGDPLDAAYGFWARSTAMDGEVIVVGSPLHNERKSGSVYFFERQGDGEWGLQSHIVSPADPEYVDTFGESVAVDGDRALVGAPSSIFNSFVGVVYLCERDASGQWEVTDSLTDPSGLVGTRFGAAVALDGTRAVVGAPSSDGNAGAAYLFEHDGNEWQLTETWNAPREEAASYYGHSVGVHEEQIRVAGQPEGQADGSVPGVTDLFVFNGVSWERRATIRGTWTSAKALRDSALVAVQDSILIDDEWRVVVDFRDVTQIGTSFQALEDPVSLAVGADRSLLVDVGEEYAGSVYVVLGSASGSSPGLPLPNGDVLPLNVDPYFWITLRLANRWPIQNSWGELDPRGQAIATWSLNAGAPPSLSGIELTHAAAILDPDTLEVQTVTVPRSFELID